jgi:glucose/arabinose dehydrogenase
MRSLGLPALLTLAALGCGDDGSADASAGTADTSTSASSTGIDTEALTSSSTTQTPTTEVDTESSGSESSGSTGMAECDRPIVDGNPPVTFELVADGFAQPVLVVGDPVDTDVLYVVEKGGSIKRLDPGVTEAPADDWLTLDVTTVIESGVLSMAFSPDYENNGLIYVANNPADGDLALVVTEFEVVDGAPDPSTARDVIGAGKPEGNHNGGMVVFGPDDLMYVSFGDGGVQNDACGHGQDGSKFLGKIMRIDPAADGTPDMSPACADTCACAVPAGPFDYTIPRDNPFVGDDMIRDEIYAYGFRNPWRMSFDSVDDRLWVGDVGQDAWEEVDVIEAGDNAGWGDMEGLHCFNDDTCEITEPATVNAAGLRMPVIEYENAGARCSVVGLGSYR